MNMAKVSSSNCAPNQVLLEAARFTSLLRVESIDSSSGLLIRLADSSEGKYAEREDCLFVDSSVCIGNVLFRITVLKSFISHGFCNRQSQLL